MAITFVQYDDVINTGSTELNTIANDNALSTTTGNFIVVIVNAYSGTADACVVTGVADTAGNTYEKATGVYRLGGTSGERTEIWYAKNITGNAANITTATFTGTVGYRYISVSEFSGIGEILDDTSSQATDTSTSHSSGIATLSKVNGLIIGSYNASATEDITVGSGFATLSSDLTAVYDLAEYDIISGTGDYAATCTTGTTTSSIMTCAIFSGNSITLTETITLSDFLIKQLGDFNISLRNSGSAFNISLGLIQVTCTEILTLSDVSIKNISKNITDTLSVSDEIYKSTSKILTDPITLSDVISNIRGLSKTLTETLVLSDILIKNPSKMIIDSISLTDIILKSTSKIIVDSFSLSDSLSAFKLLSKQLTETLVLSDTSSKITMRTLSDSVNLVDSIKKQTNRIFTEGITLNDILSKQLSRQLTDTFVLSDTLVNKSIKVLSETLYLSDIIPRSFSKSISESISLSDSILKNINRNLSDSFVLSDTIQKLTNKLFLDTFSLSDIFASSNVFMIQLIDQLTLLDLAVSTAYSEGRRYIKHYYLGGGIPW